MTARLRFRPRNVILGLTVVAAGLLLMPTGCSTPIPNRNPVGETFPAVSGRSLQDVPVDLPAAVSGEPAVLLVGYLQDAQFDIDRWALGLAQSGTEVRRMEVPAVGGWFPAMFLQPTIDDGMRAGIPERDWPAVVTLYGDDAERVRAFTGTERGRNARILLLDDRGVVRWFRDDGYSPANLLEMIDLADRISEKSPGSAP